MVETREVAEQPKEKSLPAQLKDKQSNFHAALPAHIPAERFARVVLTAIQNNPALAKADRASLWNACMRAAQDGLLPDGRDGALVIYNTKDGKDDRGKDIWIAKVQWMPMIGGIRKKVRNSGEIKDWNAQVVHAKDEFAFELGDTPFIKHKPFMDGDPGPVIAAYSIAQFKSGELSREVMTRSQIEKVRSVSRSKDKGPWVDWYEEMCRKTVARRHSKSLPMSSDLDDLMRRDDDLYDMEGKSDKMLASPPKSLGARLDILAGVSNGEVAAQSEIVDPETGEITEPGSSPHEDGPREMEIDGVNIDTTAGRASFTEKPQQDRPAGNGTANEAAASEPAPGAPRQEGAASVPPGAALTAPDEARRTRIAEIRREGQARAEAGTAALSAYLEQLRQDGEADYIGSPVKSAWRDVAKAFDAANKARK